MTLSQQGKKKLETLITYEMHKVAVYKEVKIPQT